MFWVIECSINLNEDLSNKIGSKKDTRNILAQTNVQLRMTNKSIFSQKTSNCCVRGQTPLKQINFDQLQQSFTTMKIFNMQQNSRLSYFLIEAKCN